jgi:hypothetical protein
MDKTSLMQFEMVLDLGMNGRGNQKEWCCHCVYLEDEIRAGD